MNFLNDYVLLKKVDRLKPSGEFLELIFVKAILLRPMMLCLLLVANLYFTIRLGFIQKHLFLTLKLSFAKGEGGRGEISPFGTLTSSLATTSAWQLLLV